MTGKKGTFAKVYLAKMKKQFRTQSDPEYVALKYMDIEHQSDILTESVFLKQTNHRYIVKCYHTFLSEDGNSMVMALELCKNNLKKEARKLKRDIKRTLKLFMQCAEGLRYIHKRYPNPLN